jgi:hypothetical protein
LLIAALRQLAELAPERFAERSEELAYLSNVLLAGASVDGRRLRTLEAVEHAIDGVSLGLALACSSAAPDASAAAAVLQTHPCDGLFRWALRQAREKPHRRRSQHDRVLSERLRRLLALMPEG